MKGFFSLNAAKSVERPNGKLLSCVNCGLYKNCVHPKMKPTGAGRRRILIIGGSNSSADDAQGVQFSNKAGRFLTRQLKEIGIDREKDCWSMNAVNCYTNERHKSVLTNAINNCRRIVLNEIKNLRPDFILLLGTEAVKSVIGSQWKKDLDDIHKWRGFTIPDQYFKAWLCPIYNPEEVILDRPEMLAIFKQDLQKFHNILQTKDFPRYPFPKYTVLKKDLTPLNEIKSGSIAFDYETTGVKPQLKKHRIVTCSVYSEQLQKLFVWKMPKKLDKVKPFLRLLENPLIGKRAHNMKFEQHWTNVKLKTNIKFWEFDSQIAAHQIDNRSGITGLKFQTYVHFGISDYDSEISPYLKAKEKNGNAFNKILTLLKDKNDLAELLKYNAYDSYFEFLLSEIQMEQLKYTGLPF